jgi:glycosyltransferase involved in cell wall biosynthesis
MSWRAIVVSDGVNVPAVRTFIELGDERTQFQRADKTGSAGLTRNVGLELCQTDWIAFLDDDDVVQPTYVQRLREHSAERHDVVVFRMDHPQFGILPTFATPIIAHGHVGISFAYKRDKAPDVRFIKEDLMNPGPYGNEDINLLLQLKDKGLDIFISEHVEYVVRP